MDVTGFIIISLLYCDIVRCRRRTRPVYRKAAKIARPVKGSFIKYVTRDKVVVGGGRSREFQSKRGPKGDKIERDAAKSGEESSVTKGVGGEVMSPPDI